MSTKLTARPARTNPDRTRKKPGRKRLSRGHGNTYRDFIIEAMTQKKSHYGFLFWNGHKWSQSRARAKRYAVEADAKREAKKIIARAPRSVKFVRVVPA